MATVKGWAVFAHPVFLDQLARLLDAVEADRKKDPAGYLSRPNAKLALAVRKLVRDVIPDDPGSPVYRQGNTLGPGYRHWFRAKFGNGRFRLFFRYRAEPPVIIFAWMNDENSLRTRGSKNDAYRVFKGMLDGGNPPNDWDALMGACRRVDRKWAGILDGKGLF